MIIYISLGGRSRFSSVSVADESAPPEDIEKVANYVLQINLPLTPQELMGMLGNIRSIMNPCEKYKLNVSKRNRKREETQTLLVEAQEAKWVGYSRTDVLTPARVALCTVGLLHTPGSILVTLEGKLRWQQIAACDFHRASPAGTSHDRWGCGSRRAARRQLPPALGSSVCRVKEAKAATYFHGGPSGSLHLVHWEV